MTDAPVTPLLTVDLLIEHASGGLVFVRRRHPPRGWALPGGFVDRGESVAAAAQREAREETALDVELLEQFFCYSGPQRDLERHTASVVFIARADGEPLAGDDAAEIMIAPARQPPSPLCFDHPVILADYLAYRETGRRPPPER